MQDVIGAKCRSCSRRSEAAIFSLDKNLVLNQGSCVFPLISSLFQVYGSHGEHSEHGVSFTAHGCTSYSLKLGTGKGKQGGWRQEKDEKLQLNLHISFILG
ncbi:hypothetical protein ILYODFUR_030090 [Ilyodon furcidens]|uniref:Uncharacterized protein n=1 Tax=Ilyodon furcidens TaxID=33524 RepID=A0ABV0SS37_9TELE